MSSNPLVALRRNLFSRPILSMVRKVLPPLSQTEREALEAGGVWWDAEILSGKPDWQRLRAIGKPRLTDEEQAFIDGPVQELCAMVNDWDIQFKHRDLPPKVWDFMKKKGFFGLIIPREYGGLGFSNFAHSEIVTLISTRSTTAAVTVMVPNSLGPGELLMHYGTDAQKKHYLPRLANGRDIPCFGLTSPEAGSDAAAMTDKGVVCYGKIKGKKVLGMRVNWHKRYITLGPVATVLGLAFKLYDPDHLLGDQEELGITVALVPTDTPGVEIGDRHYAALQAFQNGPNYGRDVFIPMDWVIGGQDQVGKGWKMLMSALAAGRSISLPSLSTGGAKLAARTTGAYARIREQFGIPVGKFEGVQELLARIAGTAYLLEAARLTTTRALDEGEVPAVISAIMKAQATYRMREAIDDAMDVHGGKTICDGPKNYLGNVYRAIPVAITVEGANVLTRSLIIFGQGAIRCHPFLLDEMMAAENPDKSAGLDAFDQTLYKHLGFQIATLGRSFFHGLTGGRFAHAPDDAGDMAWYYRQISRYAAALTLVTEISLLSMGGALKRKEMISARLGDVLGELYLLSCVLKRFEDDGRSAADLPLVELCCARGFHTVEARLAEVFANYPNRFLAGLMRVLTLPWGRWKRQPPDHLTITCAELLLAPSDTRDRLTQGIYMGREGDGIELVETAFRLTVEAEEGRGKMRHARVGDVDQAVKANLLTKEQAGRIRAAEEAVDRAIQVDSFRKSELQEDAPPPKRKTTVRKTTVRKPVKKAQKEDAQS